MRGRAEPGVSQHPSHISHEAIAEEGKQSARKSDLPVLVLVAPNPEPVPKPELWLVWPNPVPPPPPKPKDMVSVGIEDLCLHREEVTTDVEN
jgi:hypothetical protein